MSMSIYYADKSRVKDSLALAAKLDRLWTDDRFTPARRDARDAREFINAWLITSYAISDHHAAFTETLRRTGLDRPYGWRGVVSRDSPRFDGLRDLHQRRCPVPKTRGPRVGEPCGGPQSHQTRVTDPETGEWTYQGWCRQHESHWRIMAAREKTLTNVPEPMPNAGGLLPCYIHASNWPDVYAWARPDWKPPYVGICADDWPVMGKAVKAPLMKVALSLVADPEPTAGCPANAIELGSREPATPPPSLRLVTS